MVLLAGLGGPVGCAGPGPTPASTATAAPAAQRDSPGLQWVSMLPELDDTAQIDAALRVHTQRLEHSDPEERVRARLDLARAQSDKARSMFLQSAAALDRSIDAPPPLREELWRRKAELDEQEQAWLERAAASYQHVIDSREPIARTLRPEARFGLADVYGCRDQWTESNAQLSALVREDPEHALVIPAMLQLADAAFSEQRLADAQVLYQRVVSAGPGPEQAYAFYKLGWVAFNEDDGQLALDYWTAVVTSTRGVPDQENLARAAASDCVLAYAMVGRPQSARGFFSRLYRERSSELLRRLADHYHREGREDAAAIVEGRVGILPSQR